MSKFNPEQIYKTLVETSPDAIIMVDTNAKVILANDAAIKIHAANSKKDLLGKSGLDFILPEYHDKVLNNMKQIFISKKPRITEYRIKDIAGNITPIEISSSAIFDSENKPMGIIGIMRDISKSYALEREKEETENKFKSVAEKSPSMIFINRGGRVVYVNQQCVQVLGYSRKEFYSENFDFMDMVVPEHRASIQKKFREHVINKKDIPDYEYDILTKSGQRLSVINSTKLVEIDGEWGIIGVVTNITERKRSEEHQEFLSSISEQVSDSIIVTDLDYKITYVNNAMLKLYDYSKAELISQSPDMLSADPSRKDIHEKIYELLSKGKSWSGTLLNKKKNGNIFPCEMIISPLYIKDNIIGYMATQRDISQRRQVLEKLQSSEAKYSNLFHFSNDAIIIFDLNGYIKDVNNSAMELFGYTQKEFLKLKITDLCLPEQYEEINEKLETIIIEGFIRLELEAERKNSEIRSVEIAASLFEIDRVEHIQCVMRDITDRKRSEEAVHNSEKKFREFTDMLPQVVYEAGGDLCIKYVNKMVTRFFEYEPSEMIGMNIIDVIAPEHKTLALENVKKRMLGKKIGSKLYNAITKSGKRFPILVFSEAVYKNNEFIGVRGLVVDMTERRQAELELIQAQKLASIGQLSAGLAHEINNPLSALSGEIQWLMENTTDKALLKSLRFMHRVSIRIAKIIKDLLSFSRESSLLGQKHSDINKLLDVTLQLIKRRYKLANIKIKRNYNTELPQVSVNRGQIEQVFMNLLQNSLQAMAKGGELNITTDYIKTRKEIKIIFEDTGKGIEKEALDKIFDPFFTTKPPGSGTGLGLSISHGIIKNHGGKIKLESVVGKGTKVIILLSVLGGKNK